VRPVGHSLKLATLDQESSEYKSSSPLSPPPSLRNMFQQQQQQQEEPTVGQLLTIIATLQQQVNTMLLQQQGSKVEVARPQVFSGKIEEVSTFVNTARLYIRMKMMEETAATQVAWVLSYVQGGVAEA